MGGVPPNERPGDRSWGHHDNELEATREVRVSGHSGPRSPEGPWIWVLGPLLSQTQGSRPQLLEWLPPPEPRRTEPHGSPPEKLSSFEGVGDPTARNQSRRRLKVRHLDSEPRL